MTEPTHSRAALEAETARRIAVRRGHGQDERTARRLVAAELLIEDGLDRLGPAATAEHASAALDRLIDALQILQDTVANAAGVISQRGYQVVKVGAVPQAPEPS